MKWVKRLTGTVILLSLSLILYCASFYAKCFLENQKEKNTYEKMRTACVQTDTDSNIEKKPPVDSPEDILAQADGNKALENGGTKEKIRESFGISWESLREVSTKIIGWIEVYGADISYPVLQGTDDEYYLHHGPDGAESPFGSIFLGSDHNADFLDSHSLVYGHNMEGGMMFANLNKYENPEFYRRCPVFSIITPERKFTYEIFSIEQAGSDSPCYCYGLERTSSAYKQLLVYLKANSIYDTGVEPDGEEHVVTLITCNSRLDANVRTAIHGICTNIESADHNS